MDKHLKDNGMEDPYVSVHIVIVWFWFLLFTLMYRLRLASCVCGYTQRVSRLNSNAATKKKMEHVNRLVHLESDHTLTADSLVHQGAMQYLKSLRSELHSNDFIVVDVILQTAALNELSRLLLSSTVFFDVTNGAAFASHADDGLVFKSMQSLVQVYFSLWFYLPVCLYFELSDKVTLLCLHCIPFCVLASSVGLVESRETTHCQ